MEVLQLNVININNRSQALRCIKRFKIVFICVGYLYSCTCIHYIVSNVSAAASTSHTVGSYGTEKLLT